MFQRPLVLVLVIALIYAVAGRLGLLLAIPPGYATALFPPAGIALAAVIGFGYRVLPGVWLGSLLLNVSVSWPAEGLPSVPSVLLAAMIGLGAALQALAGFWLVRRFVGLPLQFDEERTLLRFAFVGGALSTLIGASVGVGLLHQSGRISASEAPYSWLTWWVGDSIGVLIIAPLVLLALAPANSEARQQLRASLLPIGVTFALVTIIFVRASNWENQQLLDRFTTRANQIHSSIRNQFDRQLTYLNQLERFFVSSDSVTPEEFATFTRDILSHEQGNVSFSWIHVVRHDDRVAFEQQMQAMGLADYRIWEWQENAQPQPATARSQYFPISFIEPARSHWLRGYDNGSDARRRALMERTLASGHPTVSEALWLRQLDEQQIAVLVAMPVKYTGQPFVSDLVVVGVRLEPLLESALRAQLLDGLALRLIDNDAPEGNRVLYAGAARQERGNGFRNSHSFSFGQRQWSIELAATPAYLAEQRSWQAWLVLVAGMLFTGLIGAVLLLTHGRTLKVQRLVAQRTAELSRQQQTLQTITDSTPDAILLIDENARIQLANPAAERLLQSSAVLLRGVTLAQWLPRWQPSWLHEAEQRGLQGVRQEARLQQPDGNTREIEVALTALQSGNEKRYCCLLHDLTQRIAVEQMKREFVAMVSHELRTPLTSIRGSLALLRGLGTNVDASQSEQLLRLADDNSKRLLALVNDLLDFEKLEMGKLDVILQSVMLRPLLENCLAELQGFAVGQAISLTLQFDLPESYHVQLAPDRFAQVMSNLLSNAIKFSPRGAEVRLHAMQLKQGFRIEVIDHGIGIPLHQQGNIFQKFWQADASASRRHSGTGLGLAISRGLVEAMAGQIGFHSVPGRGSTFWLEFPAVADVETIVSSAPESATPTQSDAVIAPTAPPATD